MARSFQLMLDSDRPAPDDVDPRQSALFADESAHRRPATRSECQGFETCPYVGCRFHTMIHVKETSLLGRPQIFGHSPSHWDGDPRSDNYAVGVYDPECDDGPRVEDHPSPCSLEAIDESPDGMTQQEVAEIFGFSKARVGQIERQAILKIAPDLASIACEIADLPHDKEIAVGFHALATGKDPSEWASLMPVGPDAEDHCLLKTIDIMNDAFIGPQILEAMGSLMRKSTTASNIGMSQL